MNTHTADLRSPTPLAACRFDLTLFAGNFQTIPLLEEPLASWDVVTEIVAPPDGPTTAADKHDAIYFVPPALRDAPWVGGTAAGARRVGADGTVELEGRLIELFAASDDEMERRKYRRRNERTPLTRPIKAGPLDIETLGSVLRRNLRQAPRSMQSQDTTQSRYQCVYCDCRSEMHADINAAINIGRKFRAERLAN